MQNQEFFDNLQKIASSAGKFLCSISFESYAQMSSALERQRKVFLRYRRTDGI